METRINPNPCAGCGNTFERSPGGGLRRWCANCVPPRARWMRDYRASATPKPATRPYTCVDCGTTGEQSSRGRQRLRCDPCRRAWQAKCDSQRTWLSRRADPLPARPCGGCGVEFNPHRGDQRWCSRKCKDAYFLPRLSAEARERQRMSWQAKGRRRRAAKRGGSSERYTLAEIAERDAFSCGLCGDPVPMDVKVPEALAPTIDHVVPVSRGGDDMKSNVQLAHFRCNSVKGARDVPHVALAG